MKEKIYEFYTRGWLMYLFVVVLVLACMDGGCRALNHCLGLKNDNVIEESIEAIIKERTGISVDLTPEDFLNMSQTKDQ